MNKLLLVAAMSVTLGACATVPKSLQGKYLQSAPRDALAAPPAEPVRWGGEIIKVEPKADSTCFEILSRALDSSARPMRGKDASGGRFIACHAGFYDPELYARGRDLTVVGQVTGNEVGKVGQFDYTYPLVTASSLYLWPKRPLYLADPFHDPWMMGPAWRGSWAWGWGWGPYWGAPPIIIHRHAGRTATPRSTPQAPSRPPQPPPPRH
ncbi:MAG: Slp family lipoprotein [Dokdonella sp.]|uniref:Slp family lipoprotein n=1 Tax=Dokdonella sp. TaxID=2291710 RepID=UPI0025BA4616|nr:Slp family lipoprotein [Dokdonella sp.]MBZ0221418.1 Slp family lipoprotein [Dokdonella sp.]MCC7255681.1 Slp family lipoprotein [Dokdonella sp.]